MSTFQINIDGNDAAFDCDQNDTLLRAALRAGVALPYECNSGGCGSCKFELAAGDVYNQWEGAPALTPRDQRKGKMLACQCRPAADCTMKISLSAEDLPEFRPRRFVAKLAKVVALTDDMAEFQFTTTNPAEFQPGQYALFDVPNVTGSRGYSMSNLPNDDGEWHFIIKRSPEGKATSFLFDSIDVGTDIRMDGPYGLAYFRPDLNRDIVCVAGGSGLSPMMSIVKTACADASQSARKVHLFYGGRAPADICTPGLVAGITNTYNNLLTYDAISDEQQKSQWNGACCFIHELVEKTLGGTLAEHEFYFCGPPPMTDACQRMLMLDHKVPFEQIHFDRFF